MWYFSKTEIQTVRGIYCSRDEFPKRTEINLVRSIEAYEEINYDWDHSICLGFLRKYSKLNSRNSYKQ